MLRRQLDIAADCAWRDFRCRFSNSQRKRILGDGHKRQIFPGPGRVAVANQALGFQILMAKDQGIDGLGKVQLIEHRRRQAGCRDVIVARSVDVGLPNAALIDVDLTSDEH